SNNYLKEPTTKTNSTNTNKESTNNAHKDKVEFEQPVPKYTTQQNVGEQKVDATPQDPDIPEYLLNDHGNESMIDEDWLLEQQILLEDTFTHFNIDATVVN